ncbi:hypothetical protein HELRODRAFT_135215, partial [Helobdella robusta]|uniref:VWFA domain-containing protein n=1 Tax=Helobdella robusta TaxID=6412 RepID=T1EI74_HELRO
DIVIILDESTSIVSGSNGNQNWESIKNFAVQIADSFPISTDLTKIGILKFSTSANVNQKIDLNRYLTNSDLKSAILAFDLVGGETNIADALRNGRNMFSQSLGSRPDAPHIMILLTDGQANREAEKTIIEANMTKAANIIIYTIGVTSQIDENQLKNIATAPSDSHYFYVTEYSKLDSIITDLVAQSCK